MFGGLAERFKAAVLKTVEVKASAGSNPVSSAIKIASSDQGIVARIFLFFRGFESLLTWY